MKSDPFEGTLFGAQSVKYIPLLETLFKKAFPTTMYVEETLSWTNVCERYLFGDQRVKGRAIAGLI